MNILYSIDDTKEWIKINQKYKNILLFIWSKDIDSSINNFIQQINDNLKNNIKLLKLEIADNSDLIDYLDITSYPCIRFYQKSILINEFFF